MLDKSKTLTSAQELAENCKVRIVNESAEYRAARTALLVEEIELRRHIERVAEMRRALPPGAEVRNYEFIGENGPTDLAAMFGRQADARHLHLHVRAAARAAVPDVHLIAVSVGRRGTRHYAECGAGGDGALADRPSRRL